MNALILQAGLSKVRLLPEAGARISSLLLTNSAGGPVELLSPYPEESTCFQDWAKGGIFPLIPYSNRIKDGVLNVGRTSIRLPPHPAADPHTLHGNAHKQAWSVEKADASHAVLSLDSRAAMDWPWHYTAQLSLHLTAHMLRIELVLRNNDQKPMPAGIGLHPYFAHQPGALVSYQADTEWRVMNDRLPRFPQVIGDVAQRLSAKAHKLPNGQFTKHLSGWLGHACIDLPSGDTALMSASAAFKHLVVHRPEAPTYLCLEPVSHVADGFNMAEQGITGTGSIMLHPGESMSGQVCFTLATTTESTA